MRSWRIMGFVVAIMLGLAAGLLAGWFLFPVDRAVTTPSNLRADYQADTVLMTAEIFQQDSNLPAALTRLNKLEANDPIHAVQAAILTAQELGYTQSDMQRLAALFTAVQSSITTPVETQP